MIFGFFAGGGFRSPRLCQRFTLVRLHHPSGPSTVALFLRRARHYHLHFRCYMNVYCIVQYSIFVQVLWSSMSGCKPIFSRGQGGHKNYWGRGGGWGVDICRYEGIGHPSGGGLWFFWGVQPLQPPRQREPCSPGVWESIKW